jgi:hypothetical protein
MQKLADSYGAGALSHLLGVRDAKEVAVSKSLAQVQGARTSLGFRILD